MDLWVRVNEGWFLAKNFVIKMLRGAEYYLVQFSIAHFYLWPAFFSNLFVLSVKP